MNKDIRSPQHVLHVFDPRLKHKPHDEVYFSSGRYIDIATTKGKDPNTLYFGSSKSSNLLSGIFLGDIELTSKVKDVSLILDNGIVTLSVKYVNDNGKLGTVKTTLPSEKLFTEVKEMLDNFDIGILDTVNSSFDDVYSRLNIIDSSVADIYEHLDVLDTSVAEVAEHCDQVDASLNELIEELEDGKYNYSIHKTVGNYRNGFKETYTLFKGDEPAKDSSSIEHIDLLLKKLTYTSDTNTIDALILPSAIEEIDLIEDVATLSDGTVVQDITASLDPKLIKHVSLDMSGYDAHINILMNTDSSINDRLTIVEDTLKWENLK